MVKVSSLNAALHDLTLERATNAAGANRVLSRPEQKSLEPFIRESADHIRADRKYARVTPEALAARTATDAAAIWAEHNQKSGPGRGRLSKAELAAVAKANPALGALSQIAALRLAQGNGAGPADAVKSFFASYNFVPDENTGQDPLHGGLPGATLIDARPIFPENRVDLPKGVLSSYDFYERAMDADFATVSLQRGKIGGHELHFVYTTTDGDDAYLEVLDKEGAPVLSGSLEADTLVGWDTFFGQTRFSPRLVMLDEPANVEGMSEPESRAELGQVPHDWPGDLQIASGSLAYDPTNYRLKAVNVAGLATSPRKELGLAALEYLWEASLKHRVLGSQEPFVFGPQSEGTLTLGSFTKPDGKTYEVADWRDIDDGSYTLYFDRTQEDRLKLAIIQFNN